MTTYKSTYRASSILLLLLFVFTMGQMAMAQTSQQRLQISENNKKTALASFRSNLISEYALERTKLKEVAKLNN